MYNKQTLSTILLHFLLISGMTITLSASCKKDKSNNKVVISATGDITAKLNEFRQLLGATLNTKPDAVGGRREINWDNFPDSLIGKPIPPDFFNPVGDDAIASRQRGLVYEAVGAFMVSQTNFLEVNSAAASEFAAFSGNKTFSNTSIDLWEVNPKKPGTLTDGTIQGFGIVFSDVDNARSTSIEYFNEEKSLGKFFVPPHTSTSSISFLGVYFKDEKVTKVRVKHDGLLISGEKDISQGGPHDLVILDDFLYDEPVAKQ